MGSDPVTSAQTFRAPTHFNQCCAFLWSRSCEERQAIQTIQRFFRFLGELSYFGLKALWSAFRPPFEFAYFLVVCEEVGWQSLPLILAAGVSLGVVLTMHTRSTLVSFGAEAMIPALQSSSFFNELGPLVTGLLIAGRVGAGIGAELANMRVTEQIDAIESLSIDSFKMLVVTRVIACILMLPLLTIFMDFSALLGGYISEYFASGTSVQLFLERAFESMELANYIAPTLKTTVFGFIIGSVSCFYGFTINEGSDGVRRASTNSVVISSLMIIVADITLVKGIFFLFPGSAL
jgi:phospholipid/cholesterol/gamma-HCH transport system permease protein